MKNIFFILVILFCSHISIAQTNVPANPAPQEESPLVITDQMPSFPGGDQKMMKFIQKNIKFPQAEYDAKLSGTTYITFVVEKDGSITGIAVLRGVPNGPGFDKEAMRVIAEMPKWVPGKNNGQVVRVQYNLPIHFSR